MKKKIIALSIILLLAGCAGSNTGTTKTAFFPDGKAKSFLTPLIVEFIGDNHWRVVEGFDYEIMPEGSGKIIHVPVDFETDFASIPRPFWGLLSPTGDYGKAAVLHDYLYKNGGKWDGATHTRKQCDDVFDEAMTTLKVNPFVRWIICVAVRLFGSSAFEKI